MKNEHNCRNVGFRKPKNRNIIVAYCYPFDELLNNPNVGRMQRRCLQYRIWSSFEIAENKNQNVNLKEM